MTPCDIFFFPTTNSLTEAYCNKELWYRMIRDFSINLK